jgi:quinohemoprotein ethanol dehydrogenase
MIPDLRHSSDDTRNAFGEIVLKGALHPRGMAPFDDVVSTDDLAAIKAYVMSREYEDYTKAQQKPKP